MTPEEELVHEKAALLHLLRRLLQVTLVIVCLVLLGAAINGLIERERKMAQVAREAQLVNPTRYFGPGTWSFEGKIFGSPGKTPKLPATAKPGQAYGPWQYSTQYHAWMYTGAAGSASLPAPITESN